MTAHESPAMGQDSTPSHGLPSSAGAATGAPPGFLSEAQCQALVAELARYAQGGGGYTAALIWSSWTGRVRWARNQITTSSDVRQTFIRIYRDLQGANYTGVLANETTDVGLVAAARRAERLAQLARQQPQWELVREFPLEPLEPGAPPPSLFNAATAALTAEQRADAARALTVQAAAAGVLSAGSIEVGAHSLAMIDTAGQMRYVPYTTASYSVTVRDPTGESSGWAGVDWPDWSKVNASHLTQLALDKCLKSRNPAAAEPGLYTTILEPQAVGDLVGQLVNGILGDLLSKKTALGGGPFNAEMLQTAETSHTGDHPGRAKFGERVIDARLTLSADPLDPELAMLPFAPNNLSLMREGNTENSSSDTNWRGQAVYHPVKWITNGVLTALGHARDPSGTDEAGLRTGRGLPNSGAFRLSVTGQTTSLEEMIATTGRGILVTRFTNIEKVWSQDPDPSLLLRGYTRDGLWLIEHGQLSRPIKNFMFVESLLNVLNRVEQVGVPQRVYHPPPGVLAQPQPEIVPALKIQDFAFTALADAV